MDLTLNIREVFIGYNTPPFMEQIDNKSLQISTYLIKTVYEKDVDDFNNTPKIKIKRITPYSVTN